MKIKICGLTRPEDIAAVNEARPDYIGFVFAKSKRQVDERQAADLKKSLAPGILTVGVFVDAPLEQIESLCRKGLLDAAQLHGNEDAAYMKALRARIRQPILKALRVESAAQILEAQAFPCDWLLLDAAPPGGYGGGGWPFDWTLIPRGIKPFFLAGGLTPETIPSAAACGPCCLDISSGVETGGVKDPVKIAAAVAAARSV